MNLEVFVNILLVYSNEFIGSKFAAGLWSGSTNAFFIIIIIFFSRASPTGMIMMDDVIIPAKNLLPGVKGLKVYMFWGWTWKALSTCAINFSEYKSNNLYLCALIRILLHLSCIYDC